MDDLAVRVGDSEPSIRPVRSARLVVLEPSLRARQLHTTLGRAVLDRYDFTAAVVDKGEVDLEHD